MTRVANQTATLRGRVPSAAQKSFADVIAKDSATGDLVQNALVVIAP